MRFKPLGGTKVSEVGMGTYYDPGWLIIARAFRRTGGAATKVAAIKAGLDGGMSLIDTAEMYGSEPLVAKAIEGRKREDLFIATKVWSSHLRKDALVRALENSLRKLETPYVDLYQVHWPNSKVPIGETMAAMEEMKDKGKLRHIGVSNFSVKQATEANASLKKSQLDSIQVQYSLAHRDIEANLLPYCERNKMSVLCYYPLGHGKLTKGRPAAAIDAVGKRHSKTAAQVALNWLVSRENVFAIPRASRAEHVGENLGASGWELSGEDRARLEAAFPRPAFPADA